jgi:AcrR family transcriptional regulator
MPKHVDHDQRRAEIAAAVATIACERGIAGISFREVAAEAAVSVSLVQHYFGTKEGLLIGTLDITSRRIAGHIQDALASTDATRPLDRLRTILGAFIPTDQDSREAMLLYLGFAGAALTDSALRRADAFGNADSLTSAIAEELRAAEDAGELVPGLNPDTEAHAILAMVLGLSLATLLEQREPADAIGVIDAYLRHRTAA